MEPDELEADQRDGERSDPLAMDEAFLLSYLRDRDVMCPRCGYNLRDAHSAQCVECGAPIVLSVRDAEPRTVGWAVMTAAMAVSAGIGMLIIGISVKEMRIHRDLVDLHILPSTLWHCAMVLAAPLSLALRHPFYQLDDAARRAMIWSLSLISVAAVAWFILWID